MATATKRFFSRKLAELNEGKSSTSSSGSGGGSNGGGSNGNGGNGGVGSGLKDLKDLDEDLKKTMGEAIQQRILKAEEVKAKTKVMMRRKERKKLN